MDFGLVHYFILMPLSSDLEKVGESVTFTRLEIRFMRSKLAVVPKHPQEVTVVFERDGHHVVAAHVRVN